MEEALNPLDKFLDMLTEEVVKKTEEAKLCKRGELIQRLHAEEISTGNTSEEIVELFIKKNLEADESIIAAIEGEKDLYLYNSKKMTKSYAEILKNVEDQDIPKMIADKVRKDSEIYPRPTEKRLFINPPFNLNDSKITEALKQMNRQTDYADIKICRASNKAEYLYSSKYLSDDHARHLTEWYEVEQELNP